jgi:hypothetical protein
MYALEISLDSVGKVDAVFAATRDATHATCSVPSSSAASSNPPRRGSNDGAHSAARESARSGVGSGLGVESHEVGRRGCEEQCWHVRRSGEEQAQEEDGWQTVAGGKRRARGGGVAMSHPHLGSACEEVKGVQFEVDEYGRVRHFGDPRRGVHAEVGRACGKTLEPRAVVASKFDPLRGVAHRVYRREEEEAAAEAAEESVKVELERRRKRGEEEEVMLGG